MKTIGFVGGGRVTRILIQGWAHAGLAVPEVFVHEPDDAAFSALTTVQPAARRASLETVAGADLVFLALHPPAIPPVLPALRAGLQPKATLVSLAPKISLATLMSGCGTTRMARMIPNAPSIIGQGYNPIAFGPDCDAGVRAALSTFVAAWGQAPEVAEEHLEAYAILTGMGPTYFWYQWDALREVTRGFGLDTAAVDAALRAMVSGSLATLLDSGLTPASVMDLVPVKPLAAHEPVLRSAYHEALPALHAKIRPAPTEAVAK